MFDEPLNSIVLDLLFTMAVFHGLAKLRLHTTSTRAFFRAITADTGERLRRFEEASKGYKTKELESEKARRVKRQAKGKGRRNRDAVPKKSVDDNSEPVPKPKGKGKGKERQSEDKEQVKRGKGKGKFVTEERNKNTGGSHTHNIPVAKKEKGLNLQTYKTHELGHFVDDIEQHGTSDLFNTQEVRSFALKV